MIGPGGAVWSSGSVIGFGAGLRAVRPHRNGKPYATPSTRSSHQIAEYGSLPALIPGV